MTDEATLLRFLRDPRQAAQGFSASDWCMLVREAQRNKLLSRLACQLEADGQMKLLPDNMRRRMAGALRIAAGSSRSVRWEVRKIHQALASVNIPLVLLKGAAYELAELPVARGRLFVDVDIMVPGEQLDLAERALAEHGWISSKLDAYDQQYYRQWMHEIPPLSNLKRSTTLDVHHTILPPTAALKPDVRLLWQDAVELPGPGGVWVLSPVDMVLHSAVHLFHDGDLGGGLRDLVDLDVLLRDFGRESEFWDSLLARAEEMDLVRPFYYALKYTRELLGTPVPQRLLARSEVLAAPSPPVGKIMDVLVRSALDPSRESLDSPAAGFHRWLLYVRSHYLRMPLHLLVPHLLRKALKPAP